MTLRKSQFDYKWVILGICFLMEFLCLGFCSSNVGLYTKAVTEALRRLGIITPWAPAHSALRMIAPRLWGSDSSSQITISGVSPRSAASCRISLNHARL